MLNFPNHEQLTARIIFQSHDQYRVIFADRRIQQATLAGRMQFTGTMPLIGDFVSGQPYDRDKFLITHLLPRQTYLTRAADQQEQGLAANVTTVFITMSANTDFSVNRLERYLTLVWNSGAAPVIVLTKADVEPELLEQRQTEVTAAAFGVPLITTTNTVPAAIKKAFAPFLTAKTTAIFIGSSGVGKSTLLNILAATQLQTIKSIRSGDDKGRHTTTTRNLYYLPNGAAVIDSPGLRGVGVTGSTNTSTAQSFPDIVTLARQCRFKDCQHEAEPNCAVQAAIKRGELSQQRLANYKRLLRETEYTTLTSRQINAAKIKRMVGNKKNLRHRPKR
ncbi:ribosome small subunit-dependent GTPase A [Loigolactobacillus binensis]|uniref:Small ribosomal subunit biogenesis GTPase RsgA n=1 Tax=Loigolactobacillus binensis TaxID=2559922 RepID=A0ABW3EH77_9LACO|nr:ribosome small subunit-dependent GTPase A [Loigolactobacillus binensis]